MTLNCLAFRNKLFQWYRRRKHLNPDEGLTELQEFKASMMGTNQDRKGGTTADETWGLLLFLLGEIRVLEARSGEHAARLLAAGECLERLVLTWRGYGWAIPDAVIQRCVDTHMCVYIYSNNLAL